MGFFMLERMKDIAKAFPPGIGEHTACPMWLRSRSIPTLMERSDAAILPVPNLGGREWWSSSRVDGQRGSRTEDLSGQHCFLCHPKCQVGAESLLLRRIPASRKPHSALKEVFKPRCSGGGGGPPRRKGPPCPTAAAPASRLV